MGEDGKQKKNILKKILLHEHVMHYAIIIIVAIILSIPLMKGYITAHDAESHISRVMSTVIALKAHQILPMIAPNYANGLGYSWNLFYPPLTNYAAIVLRIFTHTFTQALNLLVFLSLMFSGIFMYHFTEKVTKSRKVGLLAAIIYITIPYRISNIYIRYALGEIVSFVFIPLVFNGLYSIFEENGKRNYLLTIGAVGLLMTHNISTLLIVIVSVIFILFHIRKLKNLRIIKDLLINAIFILLIVACFYGPFLEGKNAIDYAIFNECMSENKLGLTKINLWEILVGRLYFSDDIAMNYRVSVAIGLLTCLLTLATPFVYKKIEKSKRKIYLMSVIIGVFCIFASSKYMPWQYMPDFFKFIQFPYRLLIIATFLLSIVAAVNAEKLWKGLNYIKIIAIAIISVAYVVPLMASTIIDKDFDENMYYEIEKNENPFPGSYSKYCSTYEYLPSRAFNNLKYIFERSRNPMFLIGPGLITDVQIDPYNNYTFHVENLDTNILKIEMPLMYYPGYTITFEGEKLEAEQSDIGLIMITTPAGKSGTLTVKYTGTEISRNCLIVSIVGIGLFAIYMLVSEIMIFRKKSKERMKNEK